MSTESEWPFEIALTDRFVSLFFVTLNPPGLADIAIHPYIGEQALWDLTHLERLVLTPQQGRRYSTSDTVIISMPITQGSNARYAPHSTGIVCGTFCLALLNDPLFRDFPQQTSSDISRGKNSRFGKRIVGLWGLCNKRWIIRFGTWRMLGLIRTAPKER